MLIVTTITAQKPEKNNYSVLIACSDDNNDTQVNENTILIATRKKIN